MSNIEIVSVVDRRRQKQFLRLPWDLYRDDPNWTPPLLMNQKELLGFKKHPFFEDAEIQSFLALRDGQPCGRISAIVHHAHNRRHQEKRGFFGFFESEDDSTVSTALFDAAADWLRGQGMTAIRGPLNPSFNYEIGLLVDGFHEPATFMMTYNHPYYEKLITEYGFVKEEDLFAFMATIDLVAKLPDKIQFVVDEVTRRFNLKMRPISKKNFRQDIDNFLNIYNQANQNHWGFVPLSDNEVKHMAAGLKNLIVHDLTSVAEVDGKPIGTVFALLDYNPRIKAMDGRLFPFGFLKLLTKRREIKRVRMIATHVLPEYQRWGVSLALLNRILNDALEWGIEEGEFSWVAESNLLSRQTLERGGVEKTKTYRIFDRDL